MPKLKALLAAALLLLAGPLAAPAEDKSDALLDLLIKKGVISKDEADAVRTEWEQQIAARVSQYEKVKVPRWIDELKWSGDLRLRADNTEFEESLRKPDRLRFRVRLRLGLEAKFEQWALIGVRFATGDGDPLSTNQTFTDTFRKKPFAIDLAYVTLQPPQWDWVKVTAGKMPNPIWQPGWASPLEYDPDVTPEGAAEQFTFAFGDKRQHKLFANFGQYAVKELASNANDTYVFEFQGGVEATFDPVKITAAGGYYLTHNLENLKVGDAPAVGNATAVTGSSTNYLADFQVVYGRVEAAWTVDKKSFLGTPPVVRLSGEYLANLAAAYDKVADDPRQTDAFSGQIAFGDSKKKGQWQLAYQYKYVQADANWDGISDSEWGVGGTDRKGHAIKASYNFEDWWQVAFNAFITEKISDRPNSGHNTVGVPGQNLLRLEVDSLWRF